MTNPKSKTQNQKLQYKAPNFGLWALRFGSRKGFTALEIIIAVGIVSLLGALSLVSFVNSRHASALVATGNEVVSVLRLAREKAAAGQGGTPWGVRIESGQYRLFQGSTFASAATTSTYVLASDLEIVNITLTGGGQEILFRPGAGTTDQPGMFTVRVQNSMTQTFGITVDRSGRPYQTGTAPPAVGGRLTDSRHRTFTFGWGIDDATEVRFTFSDGADVRTLAMTPAAPRTTYDSGEVTYTVAGTDQTLRVHALSMSSGATTLSIDHDCRKNNKKVVIAIRDADATYKDIATYQADCRIVTVGAYGGTMTEP